MNSAADCSPMGGGQGRGGLGFRKEYAILAPCLLQTNVDRTKYPPWDVQGGHEAMHGCVTVHKASGGTEIMCKARGYQLDAGDRVILETGGGGWGPPEERAIELIRRDLQRGYVTPERAERDYGVRIDGEEILRR